MQSGAVCGVRWWGEGVQEEGFYVNNVHSQILSMLSRAYFHVGLMHVLSVVVISFHIVNF